jgi:nitrogen fixation NifU-like protein
MDLSSDLLDHVLNPRNRGVLHAPDAVGEATGPHCGDTMTVYLCAADGRIVDIRFKTSGCWAAQAAASMMTEAVRGMAVADAAKLRGADLEPDLTGVPEEKQACAELPLAALRAAIRRLRPDSSSGPRAERAPGPPLGV